MASVFLGDEVRGEWVSDGWPFPNIPSAVKSFHFCHFSFSLVFPGQVVSGSFP